MNIRRHPLEEIQYFIIVNSIWVAQLLGKFVNACENKNTLINKGVTPTNIFFTVLQCKINNKELCNPIYVFSIEFPPVYQ